MPIGTGDIVQVTYFAQLFAQTIMTVQNYTAIAGTGTSQATQLEVGFLLGYLNDPVTGGKPLAEMIECQSDSVIYTETRAQRVWPTREVYLTQPQPITGVIATECDQPNTAAVLLKRSDYTGKRGHGDLHLAGIPNDQIFEGKLLVGHQVKVADIGLALETQFTPPLSTIVWRACISNSNLGPETVIRYHQADDRIKTMRRRTLRVGI